jgi:hypothetical protein
MEVPSMTIMHNTSYEIAVCGGGFAGIAAALAAAREGKKVILFEKEYMLGGLGTAGLVTVYLPLCDGCGHQVSFGIAEELLRLSITHGADAMYPGNWLDSDGPRGLEHHRFMVQYNPHVFAILAEQLLTECGVDILYGSYVVDAETEGGRITALHVENKSGRTVYAIRAVVDATGDADIAQFAGVPTATFGAGNIPGGGDELLPIIKKAFASGSVVAVCSQCPIGTVTLGAYETSSSLKSAGAVSGKDMTTEAAVAKLYHLFSLDLPKEEIKRLMEKNIAGELS